MHRVVVQRLDLVNDRTVVEARYQLPQQRALSVRPEPTLASTVSSFDYESVYFDTPDLTCYLLAARRRRRRFKIRTRTYV